MVSVKEAQQLIYQCSKNFGVESVKITQAYSRVLAEDVHADRDYPPYTRVAMDGYAFKAEDFIQNNIRDFTIVESINAGHLPSKECNPGECYKIMTGAALPPQVDTVIRVEDTEERNGKVFFKIDAIQKGKNCAKQGEDLKQDALVLQKNTQIFVPEIAALAAVGKSEVVVHKLPKIVIISTGDEVVSLDSVVLPHQIRETNSFSLEFFLRKYAVTIHEKHLVADRKSEITKAVLDSLDADIILLSGGVSMGDADYVPEVLTSLGVEKIFHKVAVKPGKPLWFGKSKNGVVFALPGNPVSVQVAFKIFIEPFIQNCFGLSIIPPLKLPMESNRNKKTKFDEFFPCKMGGTETSLLCPVGFNGSGDFLSLVGSSGIAWHEADRGELSVGDQVSFWYW